MSSVDESNKIYLDIDSLFDMRQAMILKIAKDEQKALEYLSSNRYIMREIDDFTEIGISSNDYKKAYSNLTLTDLSKTTISYNITNIKMRAESGEKLSSVNGISKIPEIILNIFPLKMNGKQVDMLRSALFVKLQTNVKITIINLSPLSITPAYIKQMNIRSFYCYDFPRWSAFHSKELAESDLTNTTMIFPMISKETLSEDDKKVFEELGFTNPFDYLTFVLSKVVKVSFTPIPYYSSLPVAAMYIESMYEDIIKTENDKEPEVSEDDNINTET